MTKEFYSIEEIEKYYDKETNTYVFKENEEYIDSLVFNFDLDINAHIYANSINAWNISVWDINAYNIDALNINAWDINARNIRTNDIYAWDIIASDINANDISYFAVCYAYKNIICRSIKGRAPTTNHFVLYGKLEVEEENN